MGPDLQPDLWNSRSPTAALSPFSAPQAAAPFLGSASPAVAAPTVASAAEPANSPGVAPHAASHGVIPSLWEGAKSLGSKAYHGLTAWNFEGRDAHNGVAPSLAEVQSDKSWRELGHKESIYHDNNRGLPERKFVQDDPKSFLGLGGKEAVIDGDTGKPMESGPYQATYNYCNPAAGGIADHSLGGIARNLGHVAVDVVPYWFGGTVRGDEGTTVGQRMLGPEAYKKIGDKWEGAKSRLSGGLSSVGKGISAGWHGLTGWAGAKTHKPEPHHDR